MTEFESLEKRLDDYCIHKKAMNEQIYNQSLYNLDDSISGYYKAGCDVCDGYRTDCEYYTILERGWIRK